MITHKMIVNQFENGLKSISLTEMHDRLSIRIADEDINIEDSSIAYIELDKKELHEFIGTLLYCQNKLNKSK